MKPHISQYQECHKSQFLQKLGCQNACWGKARLSSLVNKQVGSLHAKKLFEAVLLYVCNIALPARAPQSFVSSVIPYCLVKIFCACDLHFNV